MTQQFGRVGEFIAADGGGAFLDASGEPVGELILFVDIFRDAPELQQLLTEIVRLTRQEEFEELTRR